MKKAIKLILPIFICFLVGGTAGHFQENSLTNWYPLLYKSTLTPPNYLFPIVWSFLYFCMGLSVGLILISDTEKKRDLLQLFGIQLFLNFTWSILFFHQQNPLFRFINILLLDIYVLLYILKSFPIKKVSAYLFFPYLLWLCLATYLNGYIVLYN